MDVHLIRTANALSTHKFWNEGHEQPELRFLHALQHQIGEAVRPYHRLESTCVDTQLEEQRLIFENERLITEITALVSSIRAPPRSTPRSTKEIKGTFVTHSKTERVPPKLRLSIADWASTTLTSTNLPELNDLPDSDNPTTLRRLEPRDYRSRTVRHHRRPHHAVDVPHELEQQPALLHADRTKRIASSRTARIRSRLDTGLNQPKPAPPSAPAVVIKPAPPRFAARPTVSAPPSEPRAQLPPVPSSPAAPVVAAAPREDFISPFNHSTRASAPMIDFAFAQPASVPPEPDEIDTSESEVTRLRRECRLLEDRIKSLQQRCTEQEALESRLKQQLSVETQRTSVAKLQRRSTKTHPHFLMQSPTAHSHSSIRQ